MKKIIISFLLLSISNIINAQKKLTVSFISMYVYEDTTAYLLPDSITESRDNYYHLRQYYFNDSLVYARFIDHGLLSNFNIKKLNKPHDKTVANKIEHHGEYFNLKQNFRYSYVNHNKEKFLIKDTMVTKANKYVLVNETKKILGFDCLRANLYQNDTLIKIVWYSKELKISFDDKEVSSLPGLVLESYNVNTKLYFRALKIEFDAPEILEPKKIEIINKKKYQEYKKVTIE